MRLKLFILILLFSFIIFPVTLEAVVNIPVTGVRIDKPAITMPIYEKDTLVATLFPSDAINKNIAWTSSNSSIVRIINRKGLQAEIEAVSKGKVTITATTEDGSYKVSSKVEVVIPVQKVLIEPQQIVLKPGEEKQFTARVEPDDANNKDLIWQTSDSGVITVDNNGKGVAKSSGQARVIARSAENQEVFAYCIVTVQSSTEEQPIATDDENPTNDLAADEVEVDDQSGNDDLTEVVVETNENVDYILVILAAVILLLLIILIVAVRRRST
jgi:uncharacterized protein YjdB